MKVKTSQLIPGCVTVKDVTGKTKHPIIPKKTVITEKHIEILEGFFIKSLEVDPLLVNGDPFHPIHVEDKEEMVEIRQSDDMELPFHQHFLQAVDSYKKIYKQIQSGMQLDILQVRKFLIPLLERTDDMDAFVKKLHHYGNKRDYLFYHSVSVAILSSLLARKLRFEKAEWIQVGLAGLLSDSGMAKLNQTIVHHEGILREDSFETEIKLHPTYSYRLVEHIKALSYEVKLAILQHHERFDGSGYPLGVNFEKIHKYAQIIAVSDVYHAIISDRLYKKKQSPYKAIEELEKNRFSKWNAKVVRLLTVTIANLQAGDKVRLSDNRIGDIVFVSPNQPVRPIIRVETTNELIALENVPQLYIEKQL